MMLSFKSYLFNKPTSISIGLSDGANEKLKGMDTVSSVGLYWLFPVDLLPYPDEMNMKGRRAKLRIAI